MSSTSRENEIPRRSASSPSAARAFSERPIRRGLTFRKTSELSGSREAASSTHDQAKDSKAGARLSASAAGKISAASRVIPRPRARRRPSWPRISPDLRSKIGWNSTKKSPVESSSASQRASTSLRARDSGASRLIASHLVCRMSSGATRTRSASGPSAFVSSSRKCSGVRSTSRRRARPYMGARTQFRPNAAATARSASTPSGRTKTARAFRQRSSRPRIWPSRTLPDAFTDSIVRAEGPRGTSFLRL